MDSRSVIRAIEAQGWRPTRVAGSHHQFEHPDRATITTVPHPVEDLPIGTVKSTERQSGVALRAGRR